MSDRSQSDKRDEGLATYKWTANGMVMGGGWMDSLWVRESEARQAIDAALLKNSSLTVSHAREPGLTSDERTDVTLFTTRQAAALAPSSTREPTEDLAAIISSVAEKVREIESLLPNEAYLKALVEQIPFRPDWANFRQGRADGFAEGREVTDEMVNRFLAWKLPEDFHPDAGISFSPHFNVEYNAKHGKPPQRHEPIGTNLFTAIQARAMLEHVLNAAPQRNSGTTNQDSLAGDSAVAAPIALSATEGRTEHDWKPDGGVLNFETHDGGEFPHVHTTCAKCGARSWFVEFQWELLAKGCLGDPRDSLSMSKSGEWTLRRADGGANHG